VVVLVARAAIRTTLYIPGPPQRNGLIVLAPEIVPGVLRVTSAVNGKISKDGSQSNFGKNFVFSPSFPDYALAFGGRKGVRTRSCAAAEP
jgi:hypothetical protein